MASDLSLERKRAAILPIAVIVFVLALLVAALFGYVPEFFIEEGGVIVWLAFLCMFVVVTGGLNQLWLRETAIGLSLVLLFLGVTLSSLFSPLVVQSRSPTGVYLAQAHVSGLSDEVFHLQVVRRVGLFDRVYPRLCSVQVALDYSPVITWLGRRSFRFRDRLGSSSVVRIGPSQLSFSGRHWTRC